MSNTEKPEKKYITKPGKYLCTVKEPGNGWVDKNEKTGTGFIRIPCIVNDEKSDMNGCESVWYGYLSEKSRARTEQTLNEVFGWNGNWDDDSAFDSFVGQKVKLTCEEYEWESVKRVKARWLNPFFGPREKKKEEWHKKKKEVMAEMFGKPKTHDDDGDIIPF